jgi:hypothetical protein
MSVFKYQADADSNSAVGDGADAESIAEGMARAKVNDAMRAMCADLKNYDNDKSGVTTGGTSTNYTLSPNSAISALFDGYALMVRFHTASGQDPLLNVSSLGAKYIKVRNSSGALSAPSNGLFRENDLAFLIFDQSADVFIAPFVSQSAIGDGFDADLLDGQHGSYYADIPARLGYTPPCVPKATSGPGQWAGIGAALGGSVQLPAGGTWAYHVILFVNGNPQGRVTGVSAGGTVIYAGSPPVTPDGFAWRVQ